MSFWSHTPGPSWWDCIESLNPCIQAPYGICNESFGQKQQIPLEKGLHSTVLTGRHARDMEVFLKEQFSIYPRCRIFLSKDRIRQGFEKDGWIGIGIFTVERQLIACCVSKPLGRMKFTHEMLGEGGIVEYFCVHEKYRKKGLASYMLNELIPLTVKAKRLVHIFLKEGFPILKLPPLYSSQYISRVRQLSCPEREYWSSQGIALHAPIQTYSHSDFLPLTRFAANLPHQLQGDSELSVFNYKGHVVFLCMTNLHHRTVPEGKTIGELSFALPQTPEVPLSIQRLAVETCIDCSPYDIVLMDIRIPHDRKKGWSKDATFSWYVFNYNPGGFFNVKPFWIL